MVLSRASLPFPGEGASGGVAEPPGHCASVAARIKDHDRDSAPSPLAAYAPFLPPARRAALAAALARLDLTDGAAQPDVTFVSAESSAATGAPITNRVRRLRDGAIDVWLMRQRQSATDGDDPRYWSHVGIVIDRGVRPVTATFLEFEPLPVAAGLPAPIPPRVPCLRCHANGLRALRPSDGTLPLGALQLVKRWNDEIAADGVVAAHVPSDVALANALNLTLPGADAPLDLATCRDCHDDAGTVRGTLRRAHGASIAFLTESGAMPPRQHGATALTDADRACLSAWVAGKSCTTAAPSPREIGLTAVARTNVGVDVRLANINTSAVWDCGAAEACELNVAIDLTAVRTGNALRDRHLRRWLDDAAATHAMLTVHDARWSDAPTELTRTVTLTWALKSKQLQARARCSEESDERLTCSLAGVSMSLSDFGLVPPAFLAVRVQAEVIVSGNFVLERGAASRRAHDRANDSRSTHAQGVPRQGSDDHDG